MDYKIIASIIIAVGFVAGVYIYQPKTPFNVCMAEWEGNLKFSHIDALHTCLNLIRKD
jgi:hypothetical protein